NKASFQNSGFKCTSQRYFADLCDCHNFYYCDSNLNVLQGTCTEYGYFDPVETCAWGGCTTTIEPFKCTAAGYYPDPTDCRRYYQCSSALVATSHICMGGGGYFNTDTLGCEAGDC
ncbi:hypothetical protein Cfor_09289, partial [Coptotermes formosanus]